MVGCEDGRGAVGCEVGCEVVGCEDGRGAVGCEVGWGPVESRIAAAGGSRLVMRCGSQRSGATSRMPRLARNASRGVLERSHSRYAVGWLSLNSCSAAGLGGGTRGVRTMVLWPWPCMAGLCRESVALACGDVTVAGGTSTSAWESARPLLCTAGAWDAPNPQSSRGDWLAPFFPPRYRSRRVAAGGVPRSSSARIDCTLRPGAARRREYPEASAAMAVAALSLR